MGLAQNIYRRGGVYWWKSRIKSNCDKRPSRTFAISLGIHEPSLAKILGAELTAFARRAFYTGDGAMLDDNKRQFLLKKFLSEQRILYDQLRTYDRHRKSNMAEEIRQDIINAEAYRIVGQQGVLHACMTDEDRERMHKLKLSDTDIRSVDRLVEQIIGKPVPGYPTVKTLGASRPHAQARQIYTDLLKSIGIEVAPIDVMEAERLDYVARSTALAESAALRQKDWSVKDFQTADTLLEALQAADAISPRVERTALDIGHPTKIVETDISTAPSMNGHIVDIGESLKSNKIDDKHWDVKTAKQATMIFKLFAKFLFETGSIQQITDVKPSHLETFDRFLRHLRRNFGKSPADSACTIAALTPSKTELDADHKLSEKQRKFGLSLGTRKRHWGFIAQLFEKAETDGFAIDPKLKPAKYARGKNTTRARNQRPTPETSSIEAFFQSAPFTGYRDWQKMFGDKGHDIFHRAAYYVPMLLIYHGMRRAEACGLMVSEIVTTQGDLTYIDLKVNQFRRLKNNPSIRKVPLHPELIRLGCALNRLTIY